MMNNERFAINNECIEKYHIKYFYEEENIVHR